MKKLIYILPFLLLACTDLQTQLPDPDVDPLPFVHGVLFNGASDLVVAVYESLPAYGDQKDISWRDPEPIADADVFITKGSTEIQLFYSPGEQRYISGAPAGFLSEGSTYQLRVVAKGETLTASCSMPYNAVDQIELERDSIRLEWDWTELMFRARFKDVKPEGHYYQMSGTYGLNQFDQRPMEFDYGFLLLSDKGRDEQWVEETALTYDDYVPGSMLAVLHLATMTKDLYLYNQAMSVYASGFYEEGNPFIEPSILHHNIKGGLGIFGAMNTVTRSFQFN